MGIVLTSGTKVFFAGKNEFGWWFGMNIIPGVFGFMIYHCRKEVR